MVKSDCTTNKQGDRYALLLSVQFSGRKRLDSGPLVKWSRRGPLTPQTGVRLSHGSPYAPLAQLVEHLTLNQGVQGSSP